MKNISKFLFAAFVVLMAAACKDDDGSPAVEEEVPEGVVTINSKPDDDEPALVKNEESIATFADGILGLMVKEAARSATWLGGEYYTCKYSYVSTTADGQPVWLSGRMAWPKDGEARNIVVGCHVTVTDNASCPSENGSFMTDCGITSAVFAPSSLVVFPDYEGLGCTSGRTNPYLCYEVLARQVVDGVVAARDEFVNRHKGNLRDVYKTVVVGYSQGGAVAMAVQKYLENGFTGGSPMATDLHFSGSVCGDGPYDPMSTMKKYFSDNRMFMPVVAPLIINGMCKSHPMLVGKYCVSDYLYADYLNSGIMGWLDGKAMSTAEIQERLCEYSIDHSKGSGQYEVAEGEPQFAMYCQADLRPDAVVSPTDGYIQMNEYNDSQYIWRTEDGTRYAPPSLMVKQELMGFINGKSSASDTISAFCNALEANNLTTGWKPMNPMVAFHSVNDEVVPFVNYEKARSAFSSVDLFHGVVYDTRTIQTHQSVGQAFFAIYLSNYANAILNGKAYTLKAEETNEGLF